MTEPTTRERIVAQADRLFYEHGFENTSFATIADSLGISRGNFYYHFKTKDEILDAVIAARLHSRRQLLEQWDAAGGPAERIRSFIHLLQANQGKIMQYGCPVGTLCTELARLDHGLREDANQLMTLFRTWLRRQFTLLGRKADADELAMHVLAFSQGVAVLAQAYHDKQFVRREVARMDAWLDTVTHTST